MPPNANRREGVAAAAGVDLAGGEIAFADKAIAQNPQARAYALAALRIASAQSQPTASPPRARGKVGAMTRRIEQQAQIALNSHLRLRGVKGLVWTHPPNGGFRTPREGALFKAMGTRAGVADLLLWHDGRSYALELKAGGSKPTKEQTAFLADMELAGAYTAVADGLDKALRMLEAWGLLRGRAS
jgi:hypothetical protein